jgi:hypothetical protein
MNINKRVKYFSYFILSSSLGLIGINVYKKKFTQFTIDLNRDLNRDLNWDSNCNLNNIDKENISEDDPFELIRDFDVEKYFQKKITINLYNPPLTNKLYPKSNLYGHELIRYFDK